MSHPLAERDTFLNETPGSAPEPTREQLKQRIEELERERDASRRQAEEAKSRREYLESALHQAPDALVTLDASQRVVDWNLGAQRIFGYSRNEARGRDLDELISGPELHEDRNNKSHKLLSRHTMKAVEAVRYRKDNTPVRVIVSSAPIALEGALRGVVAVYTDITERKRHEEALKKREKSCRDFLNKAPVGMYQSDSERTLRFMNPEMASMLGASSVRDALLRYEDLESDLYVDSGRRAELIDTLKREGEVRNFELQARHLSGSRIWLSLSARIVRRRSEDAFLVDGFVTDITERKRAEQALRREHEKKDLLLDSTPVQLWCHTDVDTYGTGNRAHAEFLGLPGHELENSSLDGVLPEEEAQAFREDNMAVFQTGEAQHSEKWIRDGNGDSRYLCLSRAPLLNEENGVDRVVCAASDITERKELEEKLKETSFHDPATGLYTRAFFEEETRRLGVSRLCPLGIIVCHIEGLDSPTEPQGRAKEEAPLAAAGILRRCFRASDVLARIGSDAFAVLLPYVNEDILRKCRDRIELEVDEHHQREGAVAMLVWTGSSLTYGPTVDPETLFRRAEENARKKRISESLTPAVGETDPELEEIQMKRDRMAKSPEESDRIQDYAQWLGDALGLSRSRLDKLRLLARFHNLGHVGVPDRILFKQGIFSHEEFRIAKRHCDTGRSIALSSSSLAPIADLIHKHHEWWDGRGYPLGIKGRTIPLECRILAVAEAFEALSADRSRREVVAELRNFSGKLLDPELVEAFAGILDETRDS